MTGAPDEQTEVDEARVTEVLDRDSQAIRPKRIQWQRGVKRSRKRPNTVIVTRRSRWGNPFVLDKNLEAGSEIYRRHRICTVVPTREDAITCYWLHMKNSPDLQEKARRELKGCDLACSCKLDEECHADILLAIANSCFPAQK